jgi:hypothetical protein
MTAVVTCARPGAPVGGIRTLKRQLARGWVADSSPLRARVAWVRVWATAWSQSTSARRVRSPARVHRQHRCQVRADQLRRIRRLEHIGFGGTLDDRGSLRPGGGERARHHVGDQAHPETAAPPEASDGTAAGFKRGGLAAGEKRHRSRPSRGRWPGRAGPGDGRAHGQQAGRDEGWGEGELSGGVGEVAAGPRYRRPVRPGGRVSLAGRRGRSSAARWRCRR